MAMASLLNCCVMLCNLTERTLAGCQQLHFPNIFFAPAETTPRHATPTSPTTATEAKPTAATPTRPAAAALTKKSDEMLKKSSGPLSNSPPLANNKTSTSSSEGRLCSKNSRSAADLVCRVPLHIGQEGGEPLPMQVLVQAVRQLAWKWWLLPIRPRHRMGASADVILSKQMGQATAPPSLEEDRAEAIDP
eukprot:CAMPEP_0170575016 /NCGR_PEP_ID=MMETSP0224-20130122/3625_1 /TAXON_ID=285029 /ORGANISM="Togula jolla, Strain CCCM 725" /LENGTH=190 /DNA_ID=CAMNT_0010897745 /DNA_START=238 /DNA_END=807 /DNA_ORIENTATION=+